MTSVLITGGSGSFGQAFTRELLRDKTIERIAILSRCEVRQAEMAEALNHDRLRFFIGDVRDRDRLRRAFHGVDIVVHAAALKRIEVGVSDSEEVVKTNVYGSNNVVEAAIDVGVKRAVLLSSDKAWQPVSQYGRTKAVAEGLFRDAYQGGTKFAVCRYGNIWNSRGSVVPRWRTHLQTHDWVPVTDPDATRFFMRMSEAIKLVQDTINTMKGGELNIPTLPAYRVGDLAEAMGAKQRVGGMKGHEKAHEGMCDSRTSDKARRMTVEELREVLNEDNNLHRTGPPGLHEIARQGAFTSERSYGDRRGLNPMQANQGRR